MYNSKALRDGCDKGIRPKQIDRLFVFFVRFSFISYAAALSHFSLFVRRNRAVGPWSATIAQFLASIWTVQDGQVPRPQMAWSASAY